MHRKTLVPAGMWELARSQEGVLTHAQVTASGFTRTSIQRLFDDKVLWRLARGVYSLTPDPTWQALAWGGFLLGGQQSALGMRSAGHLHGLCDQPDRIDVIAPRPMVDRGPWRFHLGTPDGQGAPARTGVEAITLQLCSLVKPAEALGILARAVGSRRTTAARLRDELATHPRLTHRKVIDAVLRDVAGGTHSELERRYADVVERAHGLPIPPR